MRITSVYVKPICDNSPSKYDNWLTYTGHHFDEFSLGTPSSTIVVILRRDLNCGGLYSRLSSTPTNPRVLIKW